MAGGAKSVSRVVIYNRVDKCYKCPQRIDGAKVIFKYNFLKII